MRGKQNTLRKIKIDLPDIENEDKVMIGDCFCLHYYNVNVFFYVCKIIGAHHVVIYELAKKTIEYEGEVVNVMCSDYRATVAPVIVEGPNSFTKSEFCVETRLLGNGPVLCIPVKYTSVLYEKVSKYIEAPKTGIFHAYSLKTEVQNGLRNYFWTIGKRSLKKNKKLKKIKNYA